MNLDHLKTFKDLYKLGSFSEVARRLSISQPAVSFQIQKLEHELGIRLIDRTQKAVTLTAAGKRLLLFAESIESESERLEYDLEQMREEVTGELLTAASTIPGEFLLPAILAKFKQMHPAANIRVIVSDSLNVINGIRDDAYEIGFCGMSPEGNDLESFRLAGDEIVLIVFPGHAFAGRSDITPAELEGEPLIFREETSGTQRSLEASLSRSGLNVKRLAPSLVLGSTQAVVSAVEAGAGIAFVSSLAVKKSLALGLVHQVSIRGLRLDRDFYCVYRGQRIVSRLLAEFIKFMRVEASFSKNES